MIRLLTILLTMSAICSSGQNVRAVDSLKSLLLVSSDSAKPYVNYEIYRQYAVSYPNKAYHYIDQVVTDAYKTGDSLMVTKGFYGKAWLARQAGEYKVALKDYSFALNIADRNDFDLWQMYITNDIALCYWSLGDYDLALNYNLKSLRIREGFNDMSQISVSLNNIGLVYLSLKDYQNAIDYFSKSLKTKIDNEIVWDIEVSRYNIGVCYNHLENYQRAVAVFEQMFSGCQSKPCTAKDSLMYHFGFGESKLGMGEFDKAEYHLTKAKQYVTYSTMKFGIEIDQALARVFRSRGELDRAINLLGAIEPLISDQGLKDHLLINNELLASIYRQRQDFEAASDYQQKFIDLKSKILSGQVIGQVVQLQSDFNDRVRLKEIDEKNSLISVIENQVRQHKMMTAFIFLVALLLAIASIILWRLMLLKKKMAEILDNRVRERTAELERSYQEIQRISNELQVNFDRMKTRLNSKAATLRGIANVAKLETSDPRGLMYFSRIEEEAEALNRY